MAYPGGLQLGGGVTSDNAADFLNAGASHVIVTSFVFREGRLEEDRLKHLVPFFCLHPPDCLLQPHASTLSAYSCPRRLCDLSSARACTLESCVMRSSACIMSGSMFQVQQVGKQRLVLDLSCRKRDGKYYVVTDRWQRFSELMVNAETLSSLGEALLYMSLLQSYMSPLRAASLTPDTPDTATLRLGSCSQLTCLRIALWGELQAK